MGKEKKEEQVFFLKEEGQLNFDAKGIIKVSKTVSTSNPL